MKTHPSLTPTLFAMLLSSSSVVLAEQAAHDHTKMQHDAAAQATANRTVHEGYGVLKAINPKDNKLQIAHEAIASLQWPAMTMWLALRAPLPAELKVGDAIRFELTQADGKSWGITKIEPKQ